MPSTAAKEDLNRYLYSDSGSNLLTALLRKNFPMVFAGFVAHYSRDKLYRDLTGLPSAKKLKYICSFSFIKI